MTYPDLVKSSSFSFSRWSAGRTTQSWCPMCEQAYGNFQELQKHIRDHQDCVNNEEEYEEIGCTTCGECFTSHDLDKHLKRGCHGPQFHCTPRCGRIFNSQEELNKHRKGAEIHRESNYLILDFEDFNNRGPPATFCESCNTQFGTKRAMTRHPCRPTSMAPTGQKKKRKVKCFLCPRYFTTPSGMAQHVESGVCRSGLHRHHITAAVHNLQVVPNISIAPDRRATRPAIAAATEKAFNGLHYECYLCHKTFSKLQGLNAHIASPTHDSEQFVCPNPSCARDFTVISALIQHIESETCGLARFATVKKYTKRLLTSFSRALVDAGLDHDTLSQSLWIRPASPTLSDWS